MRVFLDTNVLASAVATRGLCADVMREVLTSHELVTSPQVLNELERILRNKFGVSQDLIDDFILLMGQDTVLAKSGELLRIQIRDQDDIPILSAAVAAAAHVFVTGDKELLDIGRIENLKILSPRQFWETLKTKPRRRTRPKKRQR